ncbi:hypothetical protein BB934_44640 (plasmid) [Microvirga ossetica]|uniref:Uncharacterized protein n=1 Tax=Microvirga ossetica TaxID=1882682 RepID=A0A1B2EZ78_9HYPH|nr:hypothetical protein [Microvirga ossetica]ANY85266.1 hypothetical protein BB934_44640 [Microvirga ossetica]
MAADLNGLRSAVELMADQVSQLVALGGRQFEVLAQLPPTLVQSTEGLLEGLRQVAHAIHRASPVPHHVTDRASTAEAAADAELAPSQEPEVHEPTRRSKGRRRAKNETVQGKPAEIVVKSIADANGKDRFYTSIRMPRALWDRAGFGPDDRLLLDWSGEALSIERAADGGVKPKSIGSTSVVLQSWKLGNLNFDQPKLTSDEGSFRLTARPSSPK